MLMVGELKQCIVFGFCWVFLVFLQGSAIAEVNVKQVMIDSQFMKLPQISLDGIKYKSLAFEYGVKGGVNIVQLDELTELAKCGTSHYLNIHYQGPEVVFRIFDASRKKVLLRKVIDTNNVIEYGRGKCSSLANVRAEFDGKIDEWRLNLRKNIMAQARKEMTSFIDEETTLSYESIRFPFFYVSGDGSQFEALNQGFDRARNAFDLYMQFGVTIDAKATLAEVSETWEKQIRKMRKYSNPSPDDDALMLVLHRNLTVTYLFISNFNQARKHDALAASKGMNKEDTLQPLILNHERRYILSPKVAKNLVLMANLYRFGNNVIRDAVLQETDIATLAITN